MTEEETISRPANPKALPWPYFIAGMGLTLLAVALGAVLGFLARPALDPAVAVAPNISTPAEDALSISSTPATALPSTGDVAAAPTAPPAAATSADGPPPPTPTIMDFVLSDARHFLGSPDAPITLVEFSDFK